MDYHGFAEYTYCLANEVRQKHIIYLFKLNDDVYVFDSPTIIYIFYLIS